MLDIKKLIRKTKDNLIKRDYNWTQKKKWLKNCFKKWERLGNKYSKLESILMPSNSLSLYFRTIDIFSND